MTTPGQNEPVYLDVRLVCLAALMLVALPGWSEETPDPSHEQYSALEMLDRDLVVENRVRTVTTAISRVPDSESEPCLVESFEFDRAGNLVLHSPPLVGSDYYFAYDDSNELVDYGRIASNGDTYSLAEYLGAAATMVESYETPRQTQVQRSVASQCLNIEADYRFRHKTGGKKLPESADAYGVHEGSSPQQLRVKYSYTVWDEPQDHQ